MVNLNVLFVLLIFLLTSCSDTENRVNKAQNTLIEYFELLNSGNYKQAADLYGGSYEILSQMNPEIELEDFRGLWENACTLNGFQCMKVKSVDYIDTNMGIYLFSVKFMNPDGTLFVQEPCCDEDQTPETKISSFIYQVSNDRQCKMRVLDLPVYIP